MTRGEIRKKFDDIVSFAEIEQSASAIDMLITDVVMPGGSGVDLAQKVQKIWPEMPVLYISGYAEKDLRQRQAEVDVGHMLSKPLSHKTLVKRVRQLLDEAAAHRREEAPTRS